jgi:cation:H+ antiporter
MTERTKPLLSIILQFAACAVGIVIAGSFLTRFSDEIAEHSGWGRLLVGSIFLAGATSLPELSVDLNSIWINQPDLAVGDLVGSCLCNLLILAVIELFYRKTKPMISSLAGAHALSATMSILMAAIAGLGIVIRSSSQFWSIGVFPWVLAFTYVLGLRMVFYDQQKSAEAMPPQAPETMTVRRKKLLKAGMGYAAAALAILLISPYVSHSAAQLAEMTGLGQTFVGTTLVALTTSLPELIATFTALKMGSSDLALGNILGSNTFNLMLLVPLDAAYPGNLLASVKQVHAVTAFAAVIVTAVIVMGLLYRAEKHVRSSSLTPSWLSCSFLSRLG